MNPINNYVFKLEIKHQLLEYVLYENTISVFLLKIIPFNSLCYIQCVTISEFKVFYTIYIYI